jgi:hypothetical protein
MKKILTVVAILAIVSCTKSTDGSAGASSGSQKASVKFYTTNAVATTKVITVDVDGTEYGRLMYSGSQPACAGAGFAAIMLAPGQHVANIKDPGSPYATRQVYFNVPAAVSGCIFYDLK